MKFSFESVLKTGTQHRLKKVENAEKQLLKDAVGYLPTPRGSRSFSVTHRGPTTRAPAAQTPASNDQKLAQDAMNYLAPTFGDKRSFSVRHTGSFFVPGKQPLSRCVTNNQKLLKNAEKQVPRLSSASDVKYTGSFFG